MKPIFLAAFFIFFATSLAFSQQHIAVGGDTKKDAARKKAGTEDNPVVVKVLPSSKAEKEAADQREHRQEELQGELNSLTAKLAEYTKDLSRFTRILAAIGVLQLVVFWSQGRQLKRTVEAAIAEKKPYLFPGSLEDGLLAVNEIKDGFASISMRPLTLGPKPWVNFLFHNIGGTAAIIENFRSEIFLGEKFPIVAKFSKSSTVWEAKTPVRSDEWYPPVAEDRDVKPLRCEYPRNLTQNECDALVDGTMHFFFFGWVSYSDVFGFMYTRTFCYKALREGLAAYGGSAYNHETRKRIPNPRPLWKVLFWKILRKGGTPS